MAGEPDAEHQYSPSRWALQPLVEHLDRYRQLSARHIGADLTRRGSPLLVYVHGGYWQELSASDSLFMADDALASGIGVHAVEYRLAPAVTIAGIVEECVRDVAAVIARVGPSRTVLAGSSAGAHLAAMVRADRRVAGLIDATVLLSGIYDLRPLVGTSVNDALGLDEAGATAVSPALLPVVAGGDEVLCAVAEHESDEFIRQNREYAARLAGAGAKVSSLIVPGRDHFDLPLDLVRPGTTVGDWVLARATEGTP